MSKRIKVTISIGDRQISLAGPEDFVRAEVERLTHSPASPAISNENSSRPSQGAPASERALLDEKLPKGHSERVAVLAFALRERGAGEFTEADLRRAYVRARERPPKVVSQAIRDAKNKFDYIEPGRSKGTYRLSAHGERTVVFDLPRKKEGENK
jgi:hypothetical protein